MAKLLRIFPPLVLFILILLSVIGYFSKTFYFAELASHFNVQYAGISIALCLIFIWRKVWLKWFVLAIVIAVINLIPIFQLYTGDQPATDAASFKLLSINLLRSNENSEEVLYYLNDKSPDVVVLMEYTPNWDKVLDTLKKQYPFRHAVPLEGNFGIAVWSKVEAVFEERYYAMDEVPSIKTKLKWEGEEIDLLATHPTPPTNPFDWDARNIQFERIEKERIKNINKPFVLIGDFNTTSFTGAFKKLKENTLTRDSRKGFGLQPTWPTWNKLFFISLDHCLVSDEVVVLNRKTGKYIGSDHLPIELNLTLKNRL